MTATKKSEEWASWTCATCQAAMDDPVSICENGHVNFLGPILPSGSGLYDRGLHRRAFKTKGDRRRAWKEDCTIRYHLNLIAAAWNKSKEARERSQG